MFVGYGDLCKNGRRLGCVELLETIQKRVKPKYHIYGHVHGGKYCIFQTFPSFMHSPVELLVFFTMGITEIST